MAFDRHLMTSPDELFSDLEATGQARRNAAPASRPRCRHRAAGCAPPAWLGRTHRPAPGWPWLLAFAVAGAVGGQFSYACPEGLSASCRAEEWRLALPHHHYVHVAAGIAEFAFGTLPSISRGSAHGRRETPVTKVVRWTGRTMVVAYPLLGLAYLTDRFGAFVEPIFFTCFSVMVLAELLETYRALRMAERPARLPRRRSCGTPARSCSGCPATEPWLRFVPTSDAGREPLPAAGGGWGPHGANAAVGSA